LVVLGRGGLRLGLTRLRVGAGLAVGLGVHAGALTGGLRLALHVRAALLLRTAVHLSAATATLLHLSATARRAAFLGCAFGHGQTRARKQRRGGNRRQKRFLHTHLL